MHQDFFSSKNVKGDKSLKACLKRSNEDIQRSWIASASCNTKQGYIVGLDDCHDLTHRIMRVSTQTPKQQNPYHPT